jgi:cytochrome c oxidase subunit 3
MAAAHDGRRRSIPGGTFMVEAAHTTDDAGGHVHHWETSWGPMAIAFGVMFLVPLTFSEYFVYHNNLLAILFAGIGAPLVLSGVGRWIYEGATQPGVIQNVSPVGVSVFIVGEILIFLGLFAAYWALRLSAGPNWPPAGTPEISKIMPLVMTVILVTSSYTYHVAEEKLETGDRSGFLKMMVVTLLIGLLFLGCTIFEYTHLYHEGFTPGTNQYSAAFYSLTGFHASHVLVGLLSFVAIIISFLRFEPNHLFVKVAGIYWHFVDIVWFFVASQVYFW